MLLLHCDFEEPFGLILAEVGGDLLAHNCRWERDLLLRGANLRGGLSLDSCTIEGSLDVQLAAIQFLRTERSERMLDVTRIGRLKGYGLKAAGGVTLPSCRIGTAMRDGRANAPAVDLTGAELAYLRFLEREAYARQLTEDWFVKQPRAKQISHCRALQCYVDGDVMLRTARIGLVDLFGLQVAHGVDVDGCQISGDLLAPSHLTAARLLSDRFRGMVPMPHGALFEVLELAKYGETGLEPDVPAMEWLSMNGVEVGGDLDLTGLRLLEGLHARSVKARAVRLAAEGGGLCASILCPGAADFSDANMERLEVSGESFADPKARVSSAGLILNGATIETLKVMSTGGGDGPIFPTPMGLEKAVVGHWKLLPPGREGFASEKEEADTLLAFLANDPRISRDTYVSVSETLAGEGREQAAARVYRGLRWRMLDQEVAPTGQGIGPRWRRVLRPLTLLYGVALGFGTAPLRLLWPIVLLPLLGWLLVYRVDANLEGRRTGTTAKEWRADAPCSAGQKLLITLRSHAPVELSDETSGCRLRRTGPTWLWASPAVQKPGSPSMGRAWGMAPSDFAGFMRLSSILLWPPFLAFLLRRALRD